MRRWEFTASCFRHGERAADILAALGINGLLGFKFFSEFFKIVQFYSLITVDSLIHYRSFSLNILH